MAFTYVGDLSSSLDRVRFYIGDTTDGTGVKPDGANFTDAELNGLISAEGSWEAAAAAAAEVLAMLYANQVDITVGPRREALSQQADRYQKLAAKWRRQASSNNLVQVAPTRVDGFSNDVDAEEV